MTSTLSWLDFSDSERRRALQVIELFEMHETRDELGLGTIRDAFAEALFPGISTVQRRARYFLFVPWLFEAAERGAGNALDAARSAELALVGVLSHGEDKDGVIGLRAGRRLRQLPSMIYWSGLERWGIRTRRGTREQWSRSHRAGSVNDDGEWDRPAGWWHDNLVAPPADFPRAASLTLTFAEAEYLAERITSSCPDTLLAWLVARDKPWERVGFAWKLPMIGELTAEHRRLVGHAQRFSEVMNGAALLYNLMLAEEMDDESRGAYEGAIARWRKHDWTGWDVDDFWSLTERIGSTHGPETHTFVNAWIADARAADPRTSQHLRDLVRGREFGVKRRQARLSFDAARDTWRGAAGASQLEFRWPSAQRQILDIVRVLEQGR